MINREVKVAGYLPVRADESAVRAGAAIPGSEYPTCNCGKYSMHKRGDAAIFGPKRKVLGCGGGAMAQLDERARVVEEWLRLPESRRRHATDAVAFAYRLLRERPELFRNHVISHESIVSWLAPYLNKLEAGWSHSSGR
jgi:hypothetical protein